MKKIAIFASGDGSNAENIANYFHDNPEIEVSLIVTNRKAARVTERAARLGIPCLYFPKEEWGQGTQVLNALRERDICFIVLAGFLAMISNALLDAYPQRIVNIHPSLLPKYGGKGMHGDHVHEAVINNHETQSGITIHYINELCDQGTVISQHVCPVYPDDTPDTLAARVHALEYLHYPQVIASLLSE